MNRLTRTILPVCRTKYYSTTASTSTTTTPNTPPDTPKQNDYDQAHGYGTVAAYEQHWTAFFTNCPDTFELQRGLNNCFHYDLVPPASVIEAALVAARRLNSFATGVRVFGALRGKVEREGEYERYLEYFGPLMEASGLCTPEALGRVEP
jgi:cytochrome c oxidase subunit 5a